VTADDSGRVWERGWDGHESAQRRRLADLPLAVKLRWLEEAHALAEQLEHSRRMHRQRSSGPGPSRAQTDQGEV
jgi:hypothetical protein